MDTRMVTTLEKGGMVPPSSLHTARDRTAADKETRDFAISLLTNDFLNVPDASLELRAHLIETTLPTMVLALEKLIKEVERRDLLKDGACNSEGGVALAAETSLLEPQIDKPPESLFNPTNWLAQYLYRNNPRYSNLSESMASPYMQSMTQIGDHLKARLFELQTNRRARLRADELARKREDERELRAQSQRMEEKRTLFTELLSTIFKKWSLKNWRLSPGFILKTELIEGLRAVSQMTSIQSDDSMMNKVSSLLIAASMSVDDSESARLEFEEAKRQKQLQEAQNQPTVKQSGSPSRPPSATSALAQRTPRGYLPPDFLSSTRWDHDMFVDAIMFLMDTGAAGVWSQDDLALLLHCLSTFIEEQSDRNASVFIESLFVPTFSKLKGPSEPESLGSSEFGTTPANPGTPKNMSWADAVKEEWRRRLGLLIENFDCTDEHGQEIDAEEFKTGMMEYCQGLIALESGGFGTSTPGSADQDSGGGKPQSALAALSGVATPVRSRSVVTHEGQGLTADMPVQRAISSELIARAASEMRLASGERRAEHVNDDIVALSPLHFALREVEEEYKTYLRIMIGLNGIVPYHALMRYLAEASKDESGMSERKSKATSEKEEKATRENALKSLYALIAAAAEDMVEVATVQGLLDAYIEISGKQLDAKLKAVLLDIRGLEGDAGIGRAVTLEKFVNHCLASCAALDDASFKELMKILLKIFSTETATGQELPDDATTNAVTQEDTSAATPKVLSRQQIEDRAISAIAELAMKPTARMADIADGSLAVVTSALTSLHPAHVVRARLAFCENKAKKVPESPDVLESPAILERFFRFVACSDELKEGLLQKTANANDDSVDAQVIASKKPLRVDTGDDNTVVKEVVAATPMSATAVSRFLGVPLLSPSRNEAVGLIGLTLSGEDDGGFVDPDVTFAEKASSAIFLALDKVDQRLKAIALAESSLRYARQLADLEVDIYLNEPKSWDDAPLFFKVDSYAAGMKFTDEVDEGSSDGSRPTSPKVTAISPDDPISDLLAQAASEKAMIDFTEADGRVSVYVPVLDEDNHVAAVLTVKVHDGLKGEIPPEDFDEVRRVCTVLTMSMNVVHKERLGDLSEFSDLEGEMVDDESRRKMLFPKMMLLSARELLKKLDSRALAELKSYKKPPLTIHRVMKSVLYVSGRAPKEGILKSLVFPSLLIPFIVSKWNDTVRLINPELLKWMIEYDPTAIQKKIRFVRCNRVKKRGSAPAMYMFDWLLISLDLRKAAVEARKRRPDVYSASSQGDGEASDGEMEEDEEDATDEMQGLKSGEQTRTPSAESKILQSQPAPTETPEVAKDPEVTSGDLKEDTGKAVGEVPTATAIRSDETPSDEGPAARKPETPHLAQENGLKGVNTNGRGKRRA
ncbi:EF-hand calcium-binding domain-containing protein 5 [Irineochytrium annulatum]|nr:EF-hand calcium-binding domain-containing protein 5 [Irineochytrium annulatum]